MLELVNILVYHHLPENKLSPRTSQPSPAHHLLLCNHSATYVDFSIVTRENKKFLLELKESLLIMRDKPALNRNVRTIVPIRQGLVIRSLVEFYLF